MVKNKVLLNRKSKKINNALEKLKSAEKVIAPYKPPKLKITEQKFGRWYNYNPSIAEK